jgi:hypothetical protein
MATGVDAAQTRLQAEVGRGCYLAVHAGDPGVSGAGQLTDLAFVAAGAFRISGLAAENARDVAAGTATRGGIGTHLSVWNSRRQFVQSGRLRRPLELAPGVAVTIPRGMLRLEYRD